jgi:hypothetical protein
MTKMSRLLRLIAVLTLAAASCGGSTKDANQLCREATVGFCEKVFTCAEGEPLRADEGGTKEACVTKGQALCPSAAQPCSATETYHQDRAEQCVAAWQSLTCTAFGMQPNLPICDEICTPKTD